MTACVSYLPLAVVTGAGCPHKVRVVSSKCGQPFALVRLFRLPKAFEQKTMRNLNKTFQYKE